MPADPKKGEVWWVAFDALFGGEVKKKAVVVVSNDSANRHLNRVQVAPLTGNVSKLYPAEAYVTIKGKTSKAMADQLTTASKQRLQSRITRLDGETLDAVEHAIKVQLGLT